MIHVECIILGAIYHVLEKNLKVLLCSNFDFDTEIKFLLNKEKHKV